MSNGNGKAATAVAAVNASTRRDPAGSAAVAPHPRVAVVDDDDSIRFLVQTLLDRAGIPAATYCSAEAFLADFRPGATDCLVLDLHLPGINGLQLQESLIRGGNRVPIIFFTARGNVPDAVTAIKNGAVDFVEKPFDNKVLVRKIRESLDAAEQKRDRTEIDAARASCLDCLTVREREVLDRVMGGQLNKCIADELGISIKTVEFHRARIMQKTGARSVAHLVQIAIGSRTPRALEAAQA